MLQGHREAGRLGQQRRSEVLQVRCPRVCRQDEGRGDGRLGVPALRRKASVKAATVGPLMVLAHGERQARQGIPFKRGDAQY